MGRSTTDTCCLTLPLKIEKWQADRLEKRLEIARQIYNTLLNYELKKYRKLKSSEEYLSIIERIKESDKNSEEYKQSIKRLAKMRRDAGFSEYDFTTDMKPFYKHFSDNIGSNVAVHCIAKQVWQAFDSILFGKGRDVHFKRYGELNSIKGYSAAGKSGGTEIIYRGTCIEWKGLKLPIKLTPNNDYENQMLQKKVKYCRIIKKAGRTKNHWYVQLALEGNPVVKYKKTGEEKHPINTGIVGIDIGPQTIAYVSNKEVGLKELADAVNNIEHEKMILQRKMDRSRRATNPENYNEDGTYKRGVKLTNNKSKRYIKYQKELKLIQQRQAETRKRQHNELANHLLTLGDTFFIEDMAWAALAKRAKETEISEKTGKYKRKKRFGKSIANKAPKTLTTLLDLKLKSRGYEGIIEVPTSVKASQYNHVLDEYHKKELSERWNKMPDGKRIQRDLYSAFLLQHIDVETMSFDKESLKKDYEGFVIQHDNCIDELKKAPKTIASMGIVRRVS
ncbi:MAG: transposase [Lachnospiraceae bacterium]|nr:transposase [Lachnospiraceae bacterium]